MRTLSMPERFSADSRVFCLGRLLPSYLEYIISQLVAKGLAVYEPAKQTRSVQLYWRLPEEWAEVLHEWVCPDHSAPRTMLFTLTIRFRFSGVLDWSAKYHYDLL